jgi:hypothetical protein
VNVADRDQFYQQVQLTPDISVAELYTGTVEKHCSQIGVVESKIARLYTGTNSGYNPLEKMFWVLESYQLLFKRGVIATIPDDDELVPLIQAVPGIVDEPSNTRINRYRLG